MAEKSTKKDYIESIIGRYEKLKGSFKEVEKLSKNHKKRINPIYRSGMTSIKNLAETYKKGSRAGTLKLTPTALKRRKLNELRRLDRLLELQSNKDMYSSLDKEIRQNAWDLAYTSFINASKHTNEKDALELVERRRNISEEDYRQMTYLFEKVRSDLLTSYGSSVAEELYERAGEEYEVDTMFDVMKRGVEVARKLSAFNEDIANSQHETAEDFIWFWLDYVYENGETDLDVVEEAYIEDIS